MMRQRLRRSLCLCLSVMLLLLPMIGHASAINALKDDQLGEKQQALASVLETRVLDEAGLLTATEKFHVARQILAFQQNTGMDFVLLTTSEGIGDQSADAYVESFYDDGGFGLDEYNSGFAYFIDMDEGYHHLTTTGRMTECMTDERLEYAIDASGELLSDGLYADAVLEMLRITETFYLQDHPDGAVPTAAPTATPDATAVVTPGLSSTYTSNLPSVAAVLLFLTSIVSTLASLLTQF